MAETELRIAGIGISKDVISTVVSGAAGSVEGVASVGGNDTLASNLINVFTSRSLAPEKAVEAGVENGQLHLGVHLTVFYGYPFTKLASEVRLAVATAVTLMAGLKGIEEGLSLPEEFVGGNPADYGEKLPANLGEALERFKQSELLKDVLGEHIFSYLCERSWG